MGIISEIIEAFKLLSKSTFRYSAINKTIQHDLKKNINLIKRIDYSKLTNDDIRTLANELLSTEIKAYINLHLKEKRWVCNNKVTKSLLGSIKANRMLNCYLDEILNRADLKHNDLLTASDIAPISSAEIRFNNLKKDYIVALRLLQKVK